MTLHCELFACDACDQRYERWSVRGEFGWVWRQGETVEVEVDACPACGATARTQLVAGIGAVGNQGYPYYDRTLQAEVTSPGHRRQLCKEKGLEPLDGASWRSVVVDPAEAQQRRVADQKAARLARQREQYERDPEKRKAAELLARPGFIDDLIRRSTGSLHG